jgi:hypothetical protein
LENNNPYRGLYYTNFEHHKFMSRLSGILHDRDIDWHDEWHDRNDHDLDWDPNEDFFDDKF